jgi:hypothetical protein
MRTSDLEKWDSADPEVKLTLIRWLFPSGGSASDDDINKEMEELKQLVGRFPGTREAYEAQVDMAEIDLNALLRMKNAGAPPTVWLDGIEPVRSHLKAAKDGPLVDGRKESVQQQIDALTESLGHQPVKPPANLESAKIASGNMIPALSKKSKQKIEDLLKEANDDYKGSLDNRFSAKLADAESKATEASKEYGNREASDLLNKINGLLDNIKQRKEWLLETSRK